MIFIDKDAMFLREWNSEEKKYEDSKIETIAMYLSHEVSLSKDIIALFG